MAVGKYCVRTVDTAEPHESVQVVASRMHARNVGMLVVIGKQNKPVGIVTDRDLVIQVLAHGKDPFRTRVDEVMSTDPRTIREDSPLEHALGVMRAGPYRRLPVVDATGTLVGVLSVDDVLDLLADEFSQVRHVLDKETPTVLGRV